MRIPVIAVAVGLAVQIAGAAFPARAQDNEGFRIDVPVKLSQARVVFNLDHLAFNGDEPIGLQFMNIMVETFRSSHADWKMVAIFHGPNGYIALGDALYDRVRHWQRGNPYKDQIAALQAAGVEIELCGETMKLNGWHNADLLPGIKVNSGANFRLIELVQQGFVEIHP